MKIIIVLCLLFPVLLCGCFIEEEMVPTPKKIVDNPLGTKKVRIGMTKEEVSYIWGDPTQVYFEDVKDMGNREVWQYNRRSDLIPVGGTFIDKNLYLYFDGKNLTKISDVKLETVENEQ
ncbi:MAG: outer membrane protein assembly factor BamE [Candidatus Omnitrophica bacterium]|nr:outer membrane protein assembly factor BamE [Candidatus Omnitrophota bacterium]